jgi:hypothetical protein
MGGRGGGLSRTGGARRALRWGRHRLGCALLRNRHGARKLGSGQATRVVGLPAARQDLRLLDPVLLLYAAPGAKLSIDPCHVAGRPGGDLRVAVHAQTLENAGCGRVDGADAQQIIANLTLGRRNLGRRRLCGRGHGRNRTLSGRLHDGSGRPGRLCWHRRRHWSGWRLDTASGLRRLRCCGYRRGRGNDLRGRNGSTLAAVCRLT